MNEEEWEELIDRHISRHPNGMDYDDERETDEYSWNLETTDENMLGLPGGKLVAVVNDDTCAIHWELRDAKGNVVKEFKR